MTGSPLLQNLLQEFLPEGLPEVASILEMTQEEKERLYHQQRQIIEQFQIRSKQAIEALQQKSVSPARSTPKLETLPKLQAKMRPYKKVEQVQHEAFRAGKSNRKSMEATTDFASIDRRIRHIELEIVKIKANYFTASNRQRDNRLFR